MWKKSHEILRPMCANHIQNKKRVSAKMLKPLICGGE
jgi:hypothetical protein